MFFFSGEENTLSLKLVNKTLPVRQHYDELYMCSPFSKFYAFEQISIVCLKKCFGSRDGFAVELASDLLHGELLLCAF